MIMNYSGLKEDKRLIEAVPEGAVDCMEERMPE